MGPAVPPESVSLAFPVARNLEAVAKALNKAVRWVRRGEGHEWEEGGETCVRSWRGETECVCVCLCVCERESEKTRLCVLKLQPPLLHPSPPLPFAAM